MTVTKEKFYIIKPKAGVNLCTNPSFETATTGWAKGGTNTIARSATVQTRGIYSLKCTFSNSDVYAYSPITITNAAHVAGMDVYVPTAYTGTALTVYFMSFTSSVTVDGLVDMTIRDRWQRVTCYITPDSGDLGGFISINEDGTAAGVGEFIYIDGVHVEIGTVPTTYFDGNNPEKIRGVKQYYFTGQENASTSVRLATTRSGGELIDITSYCKKIDVIGLGMAPTDVNSIPLVDGTKRYQRTNLTSRYFTLAVAFNDTTIGGVQADRNALIELVKPDLVPYDQPLIIRYQGETDAGVEASYPVDIKCVYVSGLDTGLQRDFERANIVFEIQDSYLQKVYDSGAELDYNDTLADADYIVKRSSEGVWSAMGGGVSSVVYAIAQHPITKVIYIGGNFTDAGGDADADYLAMWNGTAWVAVVAGINAEVLSLAFDAAGNLYIGGKFTNLGDGSGDYIVKWDGSSLSSLGTGTNGWVQSIIFDSSGNLYIGGLFAAVGGVANTAGVAKWDGSVWTSVTAGFAANQVYTIAFDKNENLYIGGNFTDVGAATGDGIVMWNGAAISSLSTGITMGGLNIVNSIFVDDSNNIIIGGKFTSAGGVTVANIVKWNGSKFEILGNGVNDSVWIIKSFNNKLYIGGGFTTAGDIALLDRIAIYLGNGIYQPLDINLPGTPIVYSLFFDNLDNIYVGFGDTGDAETAGDDTVTNSGTAKTYPIITVTGPGLLRQITNTTTGKGIYFNNLTLLAGEVITMDLRPGRISMTSTFRGSVLGYVLPGSSYDFPLMPGSNRIATFIDGTTTAATTATMQWKEQYHGIDGTQYV